jgi:Arc/MetJ-type ribon-helix-helix transcriptional regulator
MKQKISVTINDETLQNILRAVESGRFRNKSHAVEFALNKTLEAGNG